MAATIDSRTLRDGSSWKRGVYAVIGPSDPLPPRKVKEQSEERGDLRNRIGWKWKYGSDRIHQRYKVKLVTADRYSRRSAANG